LGAREFLEMGEFFHRTAPRSGRSVPLLFRRAPLSHLNVHLSFLNTHLWLFLTRIRLPDMQRPWICAKRAAFGFRSLLLGLIELFTLDLLVFLEMVGAQRLADAVFLAEPFAEIDHFAAG